MRRARMAAIAASVVVVAGASAVLQQTTGSAQDTEEEATDERATSTAAVRRRTLEQRETLPGTLGYGDQTPVPNRLQGTVTALAAVGTVVERGGALARVDDVPVLLMFGDQPAYRGFADGMDDGEDVRQLEENLLALGFAEATGSFPDRHFSWATEQAIEDFQEAVGLEVDGRFELGEIVFLPGPVRVAEHPGPLGGTSGGELLRITGTERVVTLEVPVEDANLLAVDEQVDVELPDDAVTSGTVREIGAVAAPVQTESGEDGSAVLEVEIILDDPAAATDLDQAPVDVEVVTEAAQDVLAVPLQALLALAEGGYAVERVTGGTTELVGVEIGEFADGYVEVRSATGGPEIAEDDEVVVPP